MKKLATLLLLAAMLLTCFAGCGTQKTEGDASTAGSTEAGTTAPATEPKTEPATTEPNPDPQPDPVPEIEPGLLGDLKTNVEKALALFDEDASNNPADFAVDAWDGTTVAIEWFSNADVVAAKTYNITTAAELMGFRTLLAENNFEGWKITLGKSIDLASKPISAASGSFAGSFDGKGNVICNLNASVEDSGAGFFASLAGNAEIHDLGFVNGTFQIADDISASQLGTLCGVANPEMGQTVSISNIYSNVDLVRSVVTSGNNNKVGGLIGEVTKGGNLTLENCVYEGAIELFPDDTQTYNRNQGAMAGGIVGYLNEAGDVSICGCIFNGSLDGARMSGGILAVSKINSKSLSIYSCIVGENAKLTLNIQDQNPYAGGIVGRVSCASFAMSDCSFNGSMTVVMGSTAPKQAVGGLIGVLFDGGEAQPPSAKATVSDCVVNGSVVLICDATKTLHKDTFIASCEIEGATVNTSKLTVGADYSWSELEKSALADLKYNLRFVAGDTIPAGHVVGFDYSVYVMTESGRVAKAENQRVFAEPFAQKTFDDGKAYAAADLGVASLYALEINGIESIYSVAGGNLEVVITPFIATQAGDVVTIVESYTVQYGSLVEALPAA